jgi:hypothetical protein
MAELLYEGDIEIIDFSGDKSSVLIKDSKELSGFQGTTLQNFPPEEPQSYGLWCRVNGPASRKR